MKARYLIVILTVILIIGCEQEYKISDQSKSGPKVLSDREFLGLPNETKEVAKEETPVQQITQETKSISPLCQDQINKLKNSVESLKLGLDKLRIKMDDKKKHLTDLKANNSHEEEVDAAQEEYNNVKSSYDEAKSEILDREKELQAKETECGVKEKTSTSILQGVYSGDCEIDMKEARKNVREKTAEYEEEVANVKALEQELSKAKEVNNKEKIDAIRSKLDSAREKKDEERKDLEGAEDELEALLKVCPNTVN
ncbi:MAG: hypothetical protein QW331_00060 [Candidatus Woesearchaeota archaeon]